MWPGPLSCTVALLWDTLLQAAQTWGHFQQGAHLLSLGGSSAGSSSSVCVVPGAGVCRFLVLSVHGPRGRCVQAPHPQCVWSQGQVCAGSWSSVSVVPGQVCAGSLILSVRGPRGGCVQAPHPQCPWSQG